MSLHALLRDGGRKYAVVISTLRYGFLLAALGLLVVAAVPAVGMYVAEIVGAFGILGSVAVGAYAAANAAGDKWNPKAKADDAPRPRQSGLIPEPGAAAGGGA